MTVSSGNQTHAIVDFLFSDINRRKSGWPRRRSNLASIWWKLPLNTDSSYSSLMTIHACMLDHTFGMQSGGMSTPSSANDLNFKSNHCIFLRSAHVLHARFVVIKLQSNRRLLAIVALRWFLHHLSFTDSRNGTLELNLITDLYSIWRVIKLNSFEPKITFSLRRFPV